jgi:hypothetical protein
MIPATDIAPAITYTEPRLWSVRIWTKETGIGGYGFLFKAPYGTSFTAATALARACSTGQLLRFTFGPASKTAIAKGRGSLARFDEAFERAGLTLGVRWEA